MTKPRAMLAAGAIAVVAAVTWFWLGSLERTAADEVAAAGELASAYAVARHVDRLLTASRRLVGPTPAPVANALSAVVASERSALQEQLARLAGFADGARAARIRGYADEVLANADAIADGQPQWARLTALSNTRFMEVLALHQQLNASVYPIADDQFSYLMTGRTGSGAGVPLVAERFTRDALNHYRHLLALAGNADEAVKVLTPMTQLMEPDVEAMIQDQYVRAAQRMRHGLEYFERVGGPEVNATVLPLANRVLELGEGEDGVPSLMRRKLALLHREQRLAAANERLQEALLRELDTLAGAGAALATLTAAIEVSRSVDALLAASSRLAGPLSNDALAEVSAAVDRATAGLSQGLQTLADGRDGAGPEAVRSMQAHVDALAANIAALEREQDRWQVIEPLSDAMHKEILGLRGQLNNSIAPLGDDRFHVLMTRDDGGRLSREEVLVYRHLASLAADIDQTVRILVPASKLRVASMAGMIEGQFILRAQRVKHSLEYLDHSGAAPRDPAVRPLIERVLELGEGDGNVYELLADRNDLVDRGNRLLTDNERIKQALLSELDALVEGQRQTAEQARAGAARTVLALRITVLVVAALLILGALPAVVRGTAARQPARRPAGPRS